MDSESKDTSFGDITADIFQGVATLITPTCPFKMEGARWHLLSKSLQLPRRHENRFEKRETASREH